MSILLYDFMLRALLAAGGGSIAYDRHEPHGLKVTVAVPRSAPTA